jgi:hypothetical protein
MHYSLKFIQNGFEFGVGYFVNAHEIKRGLVFSFLFWQIAIGLGRIEKQNIDNLWN